MEQIHELHEQIWTLRRLKDAEKSKEVNSDLISTKDIVDINDF